MAADLVVKFGNVLQAPTIFPDEQGRVNVTVTNQGNAAFSEPVDLKLYASIDKDLEQNKLNTLGSPRGASDRLAGTDELLGTLKNQNIQLAPGRSKTFTVDFSKSDFRTASVVSPGLYYLIAEAKPSNNVLDRNPANNITGNNSTNPSQLITQGDAVIQWNSILLNAIQAEGEDGGGGTPPPKAARNSAIVHAAIYDAVNAIDRSHKPYLANISASSAAGASQEAAAVEAAYLTLTELFSGQKATFDEQRQRSLGAIADGEAKNKGIQIGQKVASEIIAKRQNDRSLEADGFYTPGSGVGDWKPTFTDGETTNNATDRKKAALSQWGLVTPFAIPSASRFRPNSVPEYSSPTYIREYNQVKSIGAENSTTRNPDQTEIAQFWAYDRADTFRPPGQWNEIAQEVALAQGNTLAQNARLFALLNIAQADAGIVAWDAKYANEQFRPITAIREGDRDNSPQTVGDPNWEPLLDTPPFPDYISGHSVFGGVSAEVLARFYGNDNISFNIPSQELPGVARSYGSFTQAAQEDAISRVYGGVHINAAIVDGVQVGKDVASYVAENFLT